MQHLYKFMLTDNSNILMAQQILAVKKEKHKHSKCFVSSCPLEITCSVALSFLKTLLVSSPVVCLCDTPGVVRRPSSVSSLAT